MATDHIDVHVHVHIHTADPAPGPALTADAVREIVVAALAAATTQIEQGEDMANAEIMAQLAELQDGQTETLRDLQRLIEDGNPTAAVDKIKELIATNTAMDDAIETASPEPAPADQDGTPELPGGAVDPDETHI
jgi:hypothetical protein